MTWWQAIDNYERHQDALMLKHKWDGSEPGEAEQ